MEGFVPSEDYSGTVSRYDPEQLSFAFRTIVELVRCGQGVLAGRLTRKAFLDVEAMLHVEGPLFIWNVLEIMYHMVRLGQTQLLNMLMVQLLELASNIHDAAHPVTKMLRSLQRAVCIWQKDLSLEKLQLLEQAWALNAENICRNCDSRLLLMYYRLVWDSSCIKLRMDQIDRLDKWFSTVGNKFPFRDSLFREAVLFSYPVSKATTMDATFPPKDYDIVKATCVSAIQHRNTMAFTDSNMAALVRLGQLKSRILEEIEGSPSDGSIRQLCQSHTTRFQARTMAYLMKVLIEIDLELGFDIDIATDRLRSVIAMREFGYSTTAPQVIHDLWQLEAFLRRGGHKEEAAKIRMETYRRLEEYVDQVPVDEV
ncbi:hypothetical protein F53441_14346 [Fusarium austroafricanum]|uniref:Uncharacterized protein n=1 Tax=Fusarium austroafricanum TaxID=2364996 RepID=A0A8H4NGF7_9HYPO|nr:hypothetical protein F53441_14346 [Fusarium austroafricanum]